MKKTFSLFAMALALFAFASCNEEIAMEEPVNASGSELVFKATVGVDTKVEIGDTGTVAWAAGDKIKVFALTATGVLASEELAATSISKDGKTAWFVSENLSKAVAAGATSFAAYIVGSGLDDPAEKKGIWGFPTKSNLGTKGIPSKSCAACSVSDLSLAFKNYACLIKVTTNRTDASIIALQGRNGEKIDQVGIIGTDFKYTDVTDYEGKVEGNVAAVVDGPGTYYLGLAPGIEFTKGFKILLYDSAWQELEQFAYLSPVKTESNTLFDFGTFDSSYQANGQLFKKMIKDAGYNPDDYYRLGFNLSYYAFFNSTGNEKLCSSANSGQNDATPKKFCATQVFSKDELPEGTLLVVRPDHMYRPEGWQALGTKNSNTRPDNIYTGVVKVDDAWWGNYTYRGFNIARSDKAFDNSSLYLGWNMMSELYENFAIYVPKDKVSDTSVLGILKAAGKNPDHYEQVYVNVYQQSFWNSGNGTVMSSRYQNIMSAQDYYPSMMPYEIWKDGDYGASWKMHATDVYSKADIPDGSVIIVKEGYQYRPDAWTALGAKTGNRPGNVSTKVVTVDSSWWGDFNYRGFNLSEIKTSGEGCFSNAGNELTRASFAIFVPKASAEE